MNEINNTRRVNPIVPGREPKFHNRPQPAGEPKQKEKNPQPADEQGTVTLSPEAIHVQESAERFPIGTPIIVREADASERSGIIINHIVGEDKELYLRVRSEDSTEYVVDVNGNVVR